MQADILCSSSKGNCTLVRTENTSLLIDCGSTKTYLKKCLDSLHQKINDLDGVLITHTHSDHISQLKTFAHLPVYAWCDFRIPVSRIGIEPDQTLTIGDIQVETLALSHDAGRTLGYILRADGQKLVYVTDTGYFKQSHLSRIADADWYIFESNHDPELLMATSRPVFLKQRILGPEGHLCNEDAALVLAQAAGPHTSQIVLAHLSEEANTPQIALQTLQDVLLARGVDCSHIKMQAAPPAGIVHID